MTNWRKGCAGSEIDGYVDALERERVPSVTVIEGLAVGGGVQAFENKAKVSRTGA